MAEEQKTEEELNEEAKLAQEALEATPEAAPETPAEEEPEEMVPATVVATQRAARRAAELETARLRGENEALKAANKTVEKSPLELAAEEQGVSVERLAIDGKLYQEQKEFENRQAQAQTEEQTYAQQKRDYDVGMATVPVAELDSLIAAFGHLLTEGDKRNAWDAGKNSGKELKRILAHRIEQAGLQPKPKVKEDKPTTPKVPKEPEAPETEEVFDPITERAAKLFKK